MRLQTAFLLAAGALLAATAPPDAAAPGVGASFACVVPPDALAPAAAEAPDASQEALVAHLARRYQIAVAPTARMVATAFRAADEAGFDPLLVLAVISIESRFNPIAESSMGAKGLMQIIPRFHLEKLRAAGGEEAVFDPESNIEVGVRILQEYVHRTGTLEAGLQFYNGALRDPTAQYAARVLAERERLEQVLRSRGRLTFAVAERRS
jgi:soluble lytic murein transglycosylase-like protein